MQKFQKPEDNRKSLGKSLVAKKKTKRKRKWRTITADAKIFLFALAGVAGKHVVNVKEEILDFSGFTIPYIGFALVASFVAVAVLESEGSLEGKLKAWKRRAFGAFMSGAGVLAFLEDIFK